MPFHRHDFEQIVHILKPVYRIELVKGSIARADDYSDGVGDVNGSGGFWSALAAASR